MKKILTLLAGCLLASGLANAVNAPRTPYQYTQPDGSVVVLVNHGDEFYHWTTRNGRRVEIGPDGFVRTADTRRQAALETAGREKRNLAMSQRLGNLNSGLASGKKKFLVILIEFDDLSFTRSNTRKSFHRMLNESGYPDNGAPGSARDYYIDNSAGKFQPTFDVYGPVTLPKSYTYYGEGKDDNFQEAIIEACTQLDSEIDFSKYDQNKDGLVDNVFFIYAGYNEAEGGGRNTIWPHQFNSRTFDPLDGVYVSSYACTSEFTGYGGKKQAGIGIFIHEFAHVLGLPDFYGPTRDVPNPEDFSPMSNGNYLDDTRTPSCFNSLERQMLGWMGDFPTVSDAGEYTLEPLAGNHLPWTIPSTVEGEQFILEMRDGSGWDVKLPKGMVIYHMDDSDNTVKGSTTAKELWVNHIPNNYLEHPCFYVVASEDYSSSEAMIYPGSSQIHEFTPKAWDGSYLPTSLKKIRLEGNQVKFELTAALKRTLQGVVKDTDGNPVAGASVQMGVVSKSASSLRRLRSTRQAAADVRYKTKTASDGSFKINLKEEDDTRDFQVTVSKAGYIDQSCDVSIKFITTITLALRRAGAPSRVGLKKYDPDFTGALDKNGMNDDRDNSVMVAVFFSAESLRSYSGMEVRSIRFLAEVQDYKQIHALVCEEAFHPIATVKAGKMGDDGWFAVDFSKQNLKIGADKGLYFGYAIEGNDKMPVVSQPLSGVKDGMFHSSYSLDSPYWIYDGDGNALMLAVELYDPAAVQYQTLASLGFSYIENPRWKEGYSAGDTFTFSLKEAFGSEVSSTEWLFDGKPVTTPSVKLSAGSHTVTARVKYANGSSEDISLELTVKP